MILRHLLELLEGTVITWRRNCNFITWILAMRVPLFNMLSPWPSFIVPVVLSKQFSVIWQININSRKVLDAFWPDFYRVSHIIVSHLVINVHTLERPTLPAKSGGLLECATASCPRILITHKSLITKRHSWFYAYGPWLQYPLWLTITWNEQIYS